MQTLVPVMTPTPGERLARFVGDCVCFTMADSSGRMPATGWRALLRTNLGRGVQLRREILEAHTRGLPLASASWRDIPMLKAERGWRIELPLTEVGFFEAKAYLLDPNGWQHWPAGADVGISVHPSAYRTANTLYCAFARLFGETKARTQVDAELVTPLIADLDKRDYTVIPPSGKLRDLTRELPHIFGTLGCKILHLLPVNPTPTTYARFGRFGSPYAALDLTAIDPGLVVFDKKSTGVDQFHELTYAAHNYGGRVFLDMVINHTGWGSVMQELHPEWFLRGPDGAFVSPGAWGTIWEDLVELKHQNVQVWDYLADSFLTWCRRGVDGFRCDAGYMVPMRAWQYIIARVQQEYPEALFLLEGLGGAWEITEQLLTEGGMQWAYSELFQNYSAEQISGYLNHSFKQSERVGLLVHYSETHDNDRLAARGRKWSLLRNRLCSLVSSEGAFGITCGVEWLATEKIKVHGCTGLGWGQPDNIVAEIAKLNQLLSEHPCFYDGARIKTISQPGSAVYAFWRVSENGKDQVLVTVNPDMGKAQSAVLNLQEEGIPVEVSKWVDLLGQEPPRMKTLAPRKLAIELPAASIFCLSAQKLPLGLHGEPYRRARQQAAWGLLAVAQYFPPEQIGAYHWQQLAATVECSPYDFLSALAALAEAPLAEPIVSSVIQRASAAQSFPKVVRWSLIDLRRITVVPPGHWLLIEDDGPFRASLGGRMLPVNLNLESIPGGGKHVACFAPRSSAGDCELELDRYGSGQRAAKGRVRFLGSSAAPQPKETSIVLLTNGRGGMARMSVDLGRVKSRYDCVLGANLHPNLPVDRHILVKRMRAWINADGFISPLDFRALEKFKAGPPALWSFVANAGDGRTVQIELSAQMLEQKNTIVFEFTRPTAAQATGKQLPAQADVRLTVRFDIEDRNFHWETQRNSGADYHFGTNTHTISGANSPGGSGTAGAAGFKFTPGQDRELLVLTSAGSYHAQPEWCQNIPHPIEQSRGQTGAGDAYSPGWFELPLPKGAMVQLVCSAEVNDFQSLELQPLAPSGSFVSLPAPIEDTTDFAEKLKRAIRAFVVKRGTGKTVVAGYPWFLDWGRDTFICARGLLAAGMHEEVRQILLTFARFEHKGTLPNTIFGEDASNRDTSDAPLWFGLVCEELRHDVPGIEQLPVAGTRTVLDVLRSIANYYIAGTPNGIRMDSASALVWSPSHFTWMDTNYPAATPREGYPVEIQALWVRLLRFLAQIDEGPGKDRWSLLADQALDSIEKLFWQEKEGWFADVLVAKASESATVARVPDALRSNCLFLISLGLIRGDKARRCVAAALRWLVVPGALRSLAPLPVQEPVPVYGNNGQLLNDPLAPYWREYAGDEDTRRKPAYHNGTAWTWTFPVFCEALAKAWDLSPDAVQAAVAYLRTMESLMSEGCLGQLPEVVDGDVPHLARGCDAQAWGATEALRVLQLLNSK